MSPDLLVLAPRTPSWEDSEAKSRISSKEFYGWLAKYAMSVGPATHFVQRYFFTWILLKTKIQSVLPLGMLSTSSHSSVKVAQDQESGDLSLNSLIFHSYYDLKSAF